MKLLLLTPLIVMCALPVFAQMPKIDPGVSHDLAIWRAAHYSDVRYKLNLTLEKMSPVLKGTIEIRVKVNGSVKRLEGMNGRPDVQTVDAPLVLDWRKIVGHEKDSTISNITINGVSALLDPDTRLLELTPNGVERAFNESNEHLIFRDGVVPGENVIKLDFTSPILTSGSAITRYIDKEDGSEYLYSLFVPSDASTAFPVFDQPDLKARFTLTISQPIDPKRELKSQLDWKYVSNTAGKEWVENFNGSSGQQSYQTVEFAETKPISTYVFAFAAGPFKGFGFQSQGESPGSTDQFATSSNFQLNVYVRASQAAKYQPHAMEVGRLTEAAVQYLETYFDYKFPFPKYDLVLIPEFPFGGMEHAGATFLSERGVIFPSEPTANDYISRANLIFHETAHQWFGDTVTMRWFDDLWLKEGFAEFMAYKTLEHVMPQYNAWKAFYERNKQAAYLTDSTKGTTPIYQPIENLSAAKSAYGNIVYRKAPSFLRQAEFYLGPDKFQTAVRAFLKKHAFANATWQDLVEEFATVGWLQPYNTTYKSFSDAEKQNFEAARRKIIEKWANKWVTSTGLPIVRIFADPSEPGFQGEVLKYKDVQFVQIAPTFNENVRDQQFQLFALFNDGTTQTRKVGLDPWATYDTQWLHTPSKVKFAFPNYGDYGYGIFLLDDKSRDYVLKNIQNEKDDFLGSMMWGSLWDSVREAELDPREYVELAIKNLPVEKDETITASVLGRVSTAMTYYIADTGRNATVTERAPTRPSRTAGSPTGSEPPAVAGGSASKQTNNDLNTRLEALLIDKMKTAPTLGQKITFYRAFLNIASTPAARTVLKQMLAVKDSPAGSQRSDAIPLKTKDRFDIVTRLAIVGDPDAPTLLADLEKTETSDDAKRYAYAADAAFATKENREKFWNDFVNNKDISESWIEAAMGPFNSPKHSDLSLPYLQRALAELPNLKRNRKIFFVNGWLGAFIGGQKSQEALDVVNKFLADNPSLDKDLRLKILENVDTIERAVNIRKKYGN